MEENMEKRVWQRVRGEGDPAQILRELLQQEGELLGAYRQLARRGGKYRLLLEQKTAQCACLRGLLRVQTGQPAAQPRPGSGPADLVKCYDLERRLLQELLRLGREDPVCAALTAPQQRQCRLLLELLGTM